MTVNSYITLTYFLVVGKICKTVEHYNFEALGCSKRCFHVLWISFNGENLEPLSSIFIYTFSDTYSQTLTAS